MISKISRASDSMFHLTTTKAGLPETDKEWEDFFRANEWRGNENLDDHHPTAGNYDTSPTEALTQQDRGKSLFPRSERNLFNRDQTVCHDCASYMANGEGDPNHEHRFEQGMQELFNEGIHPYNLSLDDTDENDNRIPPSHNRCLVCGQQVDPELDNFYGNRGEGTIGVRVHLFQPGDPGYHNPRRRE